MAKTTLLNLLKCHRAGGVLNGGYPGTSTPENWDEYIKEHFDMDDPDLVEFLKEWKLHIDAELRFSKVLKNVATKKNFDLTA